MAALLFAVATPARAQNPDTSVVSIVPNNGLFHVGDDARCASGFDRECKWTRRASRAPNVYGFNWLRYDFSLPEALGRTPQLAVLVQDRSVFYDV
jgi:hypothetical protein